jgi:hypothetical protein
MGIHSDWVARNPGKSDQQIVNVEFVLKMLDKISCPFPVGAQYIQYPSVESNNSSIAFPINEQPSQLWPGTSWEKLWSTEGVFFRTEGGQADDQRINGKQTDRIRNINGSVQTQVSGDGGIGNYNPSGAFSQQDSSKYNSMFNSSGTAVPKNKILNFSAADSIGNSHIGMDIAPCNRLMYIWKRIA